MLPSIYDCSIIKLPTVNSRSGNICITEGIKNLPFKTRRIFYLFDIPAGESRGAHSHIECHQFIIAASGSFDILLNDGFTKKLVSLNRPSMGLHIPPLIWAEELNFSAGAITLVLTSHTYNANDYIRDYNEFLDIRKNKYT